MLKYNEKKKGKTFLFSFKPVTKHCKNPCTSELKVCYRKIYTRFRIHAINANLFWGLCQTHKTSELTCTFVVQLIIGIERRKRKQWMEDP